MTQEEKQLFLKDLCARFPYGVICRLSVEGADVSITEKLEIGGLVHFIDGTMNVKPYLRPMSSMTDKEYGQYMEFIEWLHNDYDGTTITCINKERLHEYLDFIYSHHLDDNNFIEKGLALEAKEGIYKI